MGKVTITIEFSMLEMVLVPHRIFHTKKDLITAVYFSTLSAKSCSFSEGDLAEEISSDPLSKCHHDRIVPNTYFLTEP